MYYLIYKALTHSSAQAFYVVSCVFIGMALVNKILMYEPRIGLVLFITLFYATFNHHIECLCKHPDLGKYARGKNVKQIKRFTTIRNLLFVCWCISIILIFINMCWHDTIYLQYCVFFILLILVVSLIINLCKWYTKMYKLLETNNNIKKIIIIKIYKKWKRKKYHKQFR